MNFCVIIISQCIFLVVVFTTTILSMVFSVKGEIQSRRKRTRCNSKRSPVCHYHRSLSIGRSRRTLPDHTSRPRSGRRSSRIWFFPHSTVRSVQIVRSPLYGLAKVSLLCSSRILSSAQASARLCLYILASRSTSALCIISCAQSSCTLRKHTSDLPPRLGANTANGNTQSPAC